MNFAILIDGPSAAIVLGGTALATLLRAGLGDCRLTLAKLWQLGQRRFDAAATRAELALQVQEIRQDGLLRVQPHHFDDREFAEVTDALIGARSLEALLERHIAHRARRLAQSERAVRTLAQAAELAPVFGLAGTLISLSQMPMDGTMRAGMAGAIAMAVVTTLYGLLLSNLVVAPLARIVERAAQAEEAERQAVIDWLAAQLAPSMPRRGESAPVQAAA